MKITLNGEAREVEDGLSVASLLAQEGFTGLVAVERNGDVVPRKTHVEVRLAEGDVIEVVHFVGGGPPHAET
jgi:thiamine biosynthesis protein ThiS